MSLSAQLAAARALQWAPEQKKGPVVTVIFGELGKDLYLELKRLAHENKTSLNQFVLAALRSAVQELNTPK